MRHRFDISALAISLVALTIALAGTGAAVFLLPEGSVDTAQIRDQAVTNSRIANGAVGVKKLRDGSVTSSKIKDGTILGQDFNWTLWRDIASVGGQAGPAGPAGAAGAPGAPGAPGAAGAAGAAGAQGAPGPASGAQVLNGSGPPSDLVGKDGDFYIDTSVEAIYGPKDAGKWGVGISLIGPSGPTGAAGSSVLNGSGAPDAATGREGDFYIDTSTDELYGPKTGSGWGSGTSLVGPAGPMGATGATGATGAKGDPGTSILSGSGAPSPSAGNDGDFYIDESTYDLYGPKTAGAWGTGVSLKGPAGTQVLNGSGPPSSGTGETGDFYIDTASNVLYGPRTSGGWGTGTSLIGPAGTQVLNGAGPPAPGTGRDGDFYIDTSSNTIYGPRTGGAWGAGTSLVGPTGPAGPGVQPYSAQFSSSTTQDAGLTGGITPITYNTSDVIGVGINPVGAFPTASLLVTNAGRYNMQFSAQIEKTTNGTDIIYVWPQTAPYAGGACDTWTSLPDSASSGRQTAAGSRMIMTVNFLLDVSDNTCVRLAMNSTATTNPAELRLLAVAAAAPVPAVPSIITNLWRIG